MALCNTSLTINEINDIFLRSEKIFFIGIGGVSMSALAEFCATLGKEIYGYDKVRNERCARLEKIGRVKYSSTPDNVKGMDLVIYTNAIDSKNYEYKQAKRKGIPLVSRANFLGYLISLHKKAIGVCGMHGKSTVTAMIGHILYTANENPTIFCGAEMLNFNSNFKFGGRTCCVFEACEYQNSFLSLPTTDAVVLNIDYDHPDFFNSIDEIKGSFDAYIKGAKRVFINCDDENCKKLSHRNAITFGFDKCATYRGEICQEVAIDNTGARRVSFNIYKQGQFLCRCYLPCTGKHMVYNALCAFAVAHTLQVPADVITKALSTFKGNKQRMEFIKKNDTGADIFADYAHHPTEIKASISSLLERGYKSIFCVFQPHTFSRTHFLYKEFTSSFTGVERLIIAPTFSAREENIFELSEEAFALDCGGELVSNTSEIEKLVQKSVCDCVVIMGAGDLASKILKR